MSEYIAHIAIQEDSRNLALYASTMSEMKQSLQHYPRSSQIGSVTSKGDSYTVDLLIETKKAWHSQESEKMLAFFFGWRSHIAADRQFKTLFRLLEPEIYATEEIDGPTSISIYQDLFLLGELYSDDELSPFTKGMLAPNLNSDRLEDIFVGLWQNSLLDLHAFASESSSPESWYKNFLQHRQKFYVDSRRYVASYNNIDPDKMRYVVETNLFYNREDPLIQLTRSLRKGNPDRSIDLDSALEAARTQSHYARALRRNWLYLQATAAFWLEEIDVEELQAGFEVDEPHIASENFNLLQQPKRRMELLQEWHELGGRE